MNVVGADETTHYPNKYSGPNLSVRPRIDMRHPFSDTSDMPTLKRQTLPIHIVHGKMIRPGRPSEALVRRITPAGEKPDLVGSREASGDRDQYDLPNPTETV